ncbi:MAG: 3'-5' exonuclease [Clostridia bacterium]|nr:3'-5' exonuclease [Clostridia bacterium]
MILFFDTETTGLMPGRIVQLSYVMQTANEVRAKNFFFAVDYVEPSAQAVHGFSPQKLMELSNGRTFSVDLEEIYDDFLSADLVVSHNFAFDLKFMIAEFIYHERQFRYRESLCTMKYFTDILKLPRSSNRGYKYPKLTELCEHFELYPYDISRASAELFGCYGQSHDARFDTAALYACFNAGADKYPSLNELRNKYLEGEKENEISGL